MTKQTADGLENVVSGLGTDRSKRSANRFTSGHLNDFLMFETAYLGDWIAAAIVDVPARDSLRPWRTFKSDGADELARAERALRLPSVVLQALTWARLYGGAGIVMVTDQPLNAPLNMNRIRRGSLSRLLAFDRHDLVPSVLNTYDVLAENFLQPEYYSVRGGHQQIHWSHVARFMGSPLPARQALWTHGWGDSVLRRPIDTIADLVASIGGIAELMQEANVDVVTREGLVDDLAGDRDDEIIKRYRLFSQAKSIVNLALLDGSETYDRKTLNLTGIAPVIEQFMILVSAASRLPYTKLFGTSAKGLNATGEGDESNYYDELASERTHRVDPGLGRIDEVLTRSTLGEMPADFDWQWNPFKQLTESEQAATALNRAQTHRIYLEDDVVTVEQIRAELRQREEYQFDKDF